VNWKHKVTTALGSLGGSATADKVYKYCYENYKSEMPKNYKANISACLSNYFSKLHNDDDGKMIWSIETKKSKSERLLKEKSAEENEDEKASNAVRDMKGDMNE